MLGLPLRYLLKHPVTIATCVAADPLQLWMTVQDEYAAVRDTGLDYLFGSHVANQTPDRPH